MSTSYSSKSIKKLVNLLSKLHRMIYVKTNQQSQEKISDSQIFARQIRPIRSISLSNIDKCLNRRQSCCAELKCSKCFKAVYSSKINYELITFCDYVIADFCLLIFILNLVFVFKLDSLISV